MAAAAAARGGGGKKSKNKTEIAECGTCGKEVVLNGVECEICEKWFHGKCEDITQVTYEVIQQNAALHWYCRGCNNGIVNTWRKIKERQDLLEDDLMQVKQEMKGLKGEVGKMRKLEEELEKERGKVSQLEKKMSALEERENEITEKSVKELRQSFAQIVSEQEEDRVKEAKIPRVDDKHIQEKMMEMMEREKRKQNLVLIGVTESASVEEENEKVAKIVEALIQEATVKYEFVGRIGRKDTEARPQGAKIRSRPVRISIEEISDRRRLLARGKSLKLTEFREVFIVPDLTKLQQEEDKKLRDKLKEIRASGKRFAKIEKGEIIDEKDGDRVVLFSQRK